MDFSKGKRGPVLPQEPGKQRITIRLDGEVLDWFRAQVRGGGNYQTLINEALKSHIHAGEQRRRDARDVAIIDANAERLNAEALDALDYQAGL